MPANPLITLWRGLRVVRRALLRSMNEAYQEEALHERFPNVLFGQDVMVKGPHRFYPGKGIFIHDRVYLNCSGRDWNRRSGFIRVGDNCEIGPYVAIWGAGGVTIGANVHISDHTTITAHEARHIRPEDVNVWKPLDFNFAPVVIDDHVLICANSTITPGVHIGHHAMVGAGSVVITDVPPCCLVAGVPARLIRELRPDEVEARFAFNPLAASASSELATSIDGSQFMKPAVRPRQ